MKREYKKGAFLVPAYNEEGRLKECLLALNEVKPELKKIYGIDFLTYVVNDGSKDKTQEIAESFADKVIKHVTNIGLGAAIRTGFRKIRDDGNEILVKIDADLQHNPADIKELIRPIMEDQAEIVYGNRFKKISYDMPAVRKIGNRVFTGLMRWLTSWPLQDSQPGIFAIDKMFLDNFSMPGNYNYTQQVLMNAYLNGLRFAHVDVEFRKRITGRSFISFKYPFLVLPQIFFVFVSFRPLRIFGPISTVIGTIAFAIFSIEMVEYFLGLTRKPVMHSTLVLGMFIFALQTLFFGVLAELIVMQRRK